MVDLSTVDCSPAQIRDWLAGIGKPFSRLDPATRISLLHLYHTIRTVAATNDMQARQAASELAVYICTDPADYGLIAQDREDTHGN